MKRDYHIHTYLSKDSELDPYEVINKAISREYEKIAFTDHLEFLFPQWSFHPEMSFDKYFDFLTKLKNEYVADIDIIRGVEIGEYNKTQAQVSDYFGDLRPDIVLGSIHTLLPNRDISLPFKKPLSNSEIKEYYLMNLELVEKCHIDILAHLGIFTRYLPHDISIALPICRDIFQVMIEKNIALEINFSGLRKTTKQIIPHLQVLDLYCEEGGSLISLASDTHQISDFDDNYEEVNKLLVDKSYKFRII